MGALWRCTRFGNRFHFADSDAPCARITAVPRVSSTAVVPRGLEPRTLRLSAVRSDQLSYETLALASWLRATRDFPPLRAGEKRQAGAHKPYLNRFGPDRGPEPQSIEKKAR